MKTRERHCTALVIATTWIVLGGAASAASYVVADFEGKACDAPIADAEIVEGRLWDTYPGVPQPAVRCGVATPSGEKFVEWHTQNATAAAQVDVVLPATNLSSGTTIYLATFVRFDRVAGNDIWLDTGASPYQFDKLIEIRGSGFRWGIGSGWNGNYTVGGDHKFTFDAWYSKVLNGDHGPDHLVANQAPYGPAQPYLCDYERWYGVVLGVTVANSDAGRVQLWIDGTKIIDMPHYTANAAPVLETLTMHGTIAQPTNDSPEHVRRLDRIVVTDSWADVLAGGFLASTPAGPDGGPTPGSDAGPNGSGGPSNAATGGSGCAVPSAASGALVWLGVLAAFGGRRRRRVR